MKFRYAVAYSVALSLAITAPLFAPGYLLLRDAVSTPRSYVTDAALGIAQAAPRAVPQDVAVASLSALIDGGVVVKALLVAALVLAGAGAARLAALVLPDAGGPGQLVAVTVAIWNPYVAERLLQGHWSLLVGYGCLPWVAAAVIRLRTAARGVDFASAAFWIALAGLTPTGLILAAIVALVAVACPGAALSRIRCAAAVLVVSALAASPWLTAAAVGGALGGEQAGGLVPFAARAEPLLGTLGSLAGLGGIWNAEAVPDSRTTAFAIVATAVLLAVVAVGAPAVLRNRTATPLAILAAVSVLLPAVMATGPGLSALRALVEAVPGLAVLRDGQKWVALAMPGYALAGAGAVLTLRGRVRPWTAAALCCAALIAVLPDLAWGAWGKVTAVHYPPGWAAVAAVINDNTGVNHDPGPVAVLPADSTRRFPWAGAAPVLDPLPRWLHADVLSTGDLAVAGTTVAGEGVHARAVQQMLLDGTDAETLRRAGVAWIVSEQRTPGATGDSATTLRALPIVYRDDEMILYRVDGSAPGADARVRAAAITAHLVWAGLLLGSLAFLAIAYWGGRPYRRS
ncbi:MAG: hypothetical protein WCH82_12290 [Mycobacteriaceae bacterium]